MQHLLIGGYIVSVILGFISVHHTSTRYKIHKHLFLRTYGLHILMLNLIVISLTVTRYFKVNIMSDSGGVESIRLGHIGDGLFLFRKGIEYFGIIAVSYMLVKTLYQIQSKPMKNPIKKIYLLLMILSAFAFGIGVTAFLINQDEAWLYFFCNIIWGSVYLVVIAVFALNIFEKRAAIYDQNHALRLFQFFYLTILSVFFVQNLFKYPYKGFFMMIFIWFMNLFPIYWSNYKLRMENSNGISLNIYPENLEHLISEYSITGREREILECILRGFSNREIQNRLFLSPHTVKNHNYNLYKKLGVRNRVELMRKVFEYQGSK
ncbi:MAG: helix-turn-helix transcriptional regulator [Candidatus Aminicenantes bacterium]|nr:MAG: helix-turn-helix transcriptional regulator [Candidatus Aminicenantes bacterium]